VFETTKEMYVMETPFFMVPLVGLLIVALTVCTAWMMNKVKKSGIPLGAKYEHIPFVMGISVCLVGAYLMAFGEGLLGENHAGIATVIGIVGIGLISASGTMLSVHAAQVYSEEKPNGGKSLE
jgi:hypothetical protein